MNTRVLFGICLGLFFTASGMAGEAKGVSLAEYMACRPTRLVGANACDAVASCATRPVAAAPSCSVPIAAPNCAAPAVKPLNASCAGVAADAKSAGVVYVQAGAPSLRAAMARLVAPRVTVVPVAASSCAAAAVGSCAAAPAKDLSCTARAEFSSQVIPVVVLYRAPPRANANFSAKSAARNCGN